MIDFVTVVLGKERAYCRVVPPQQNCPRFITECLCELRRVNEVGEHEGPGSAIKLCPRERCELLTRASQVRRRPKPIECGGGGLQLLAGPCAIPLQTVTVGQQHPCSGDLVRRVHRLPTLKCPSEPSRGRASPGQIDGSACAQGHRTQSWARVGGRDDLQLAGSFTRTRFAGADGDLDKNLKQSRTFDGRQTRVLECSSQPARGRLRLA